MSITVGGQTYRTLDDRLYVNGKRVLEATCNGAKVYPEDDFRREYVMKWSDSLSIDLKLIDDLLGRPAYPMTFYVSYAISVSFDSSSDIAVSGYNSDHFGFRVGHYKNHLNKVIEDGSAAFNVAMRTRWVIDGDIPGPYIEDELRNNTAIYLSICDTGTHDNERPLRAEQAIRLNDMTRVYTGNFTSIRCPSREAIGVYGGLYPGYSDSAYQTVCNAFGVRIDFPGIFVNFYRGENGHTYSPNRDWSIVTRKSFPSFNDIYKNFRIGRHYDPFSESYATDYAVTDENPPAEKFFATASDISD